MARTRSYRISLSKKERKIIRHLQRKTTSSDARTRYAVLLAADESIHGARLTNSDIANASGASVPTVIDVLKKYYGHGLRAAIAPARNPNSDTARLKATGEVEAKIIATACTAPPEGYARWTVTLLTQESVAILEESLSRATVGRVMQRNEIRPHLNAYWCIPPKEDADFVANMEDILDVYQLPYDSRHPVWCMDEKPYQILGDSREPLPMRPGDTTKIDSEYIRNGTVSVFCFIQPHTGRIVHSVEETRTAVDWAEKIRCLVDEIEPDAEKIILVMDNPESVNHLGEIFSENLKILCLWRYVFLQCFHPIVKKYLESYNPKTLAVIRFLAHFHLLGSRIQEPGMGGSDGDLQRRQMEADIQPGNGALSKGTPAGLYAGGHQSRDDSGFP